MTCNPKKYILDSASYDAFIQENLIKNPRTEGAISELKSELETFHGINET